jgi:hypothetical protein
MPPTRLPRRCCELAVRSAVGRPSLSTLCRTNFVGRCVLSTGRLRCMDVVRGDGRAHRNGVLFATGVVHERTLDFVELFNAGVAATDAPLAASLVFVTALAGRLSSLYTPESANERTWSVRVAAARSSSPICCGGAEYCSRRVYFCKCTI